MWYLKKKPTFKTLPSRIIWIVHFLAFLRKNKIFNLGYNSFSRRILILTNLMSLSLHNFKSLIYSKAKPIITLKTDNNYLSNFEKKKPWKKALITSFLNVNTWLPTPTLKVHQSFTAIYFFNKQSNIGVFNLKKLFVTWNNILIFIQNIFNFNLRYTFFSSSYFKYESLSLNWYKNNHLKNFWRFTNPFIFFLNNKTTLFNDIYFKRLKKKLINFSFVVDIYYHKRTLHYLKKYRYITLGPVPISSSLYTLDIVFPTSSNSVFSNLFFVRLLFRLNKLTSYRNFKKYRGLN